MSSPSSPVSGARVLVTGAAGFIGSHLVGALLESGASEVIAVDDLRTGSWSNLVDDPRITRATADFAAAAPERLRGLFEGVDFLFHLAAEKHNNSKDAPSRVLAVNVDGTLQLFEAAAAAGVRKTVFTSSLYAAGRMSLPASDETDLPDPRTVYGISKLTGEHLLRHFAGAGLRGTALRLFFVYGPRQFAGSGYKSVIVVNFERILRGEAPVINGDGRQALDYVFVGDVIDGIIRALDPQADGETINLGSGTAVSVAELTETMLRVAGSTLRPIHAPADWTAGTHRVCSNSKAERLLGWRPHVSLDAGLTEVYAWMSGRR